MSVLWDCALRARTASFWLSKSTSKTTRFLNFGSATNSARIGFCAWQTGHQGALMWTRMDLPAFCASPKAPAVNALLSAAEAANEAMANPRAMASKKTRREIIKRYPSFSEFVLGPYDAQPSSVVSDSRPELIQP